MQKMSRNICIFRDILLSLHRIFNRKHICLDYGVMVAQQVLVLFVQVRILVVQRKTATRNPRKIILSGIFFYIPPLKNIYVSLHRFYNVIINNN